MKKLAIIAIAASTLFGTAVYAQGVSIGVGPEGAGVRINDGYHRGHDRDFRRTRNETVIIKRDRDRRHHRDWDRGRDHDRDHGRRVYIER